MFSPRNLSAYFSCSFNVDVNKWGNMLSNVPMIENY